jgi:hypothetical protein
MLARAPRHLKEWLVDATSLLRRNEARFLI